jgi:uncharacterized protein with von Willebrand factor type A (vWA) domain
MASATEASGNGHFSDNIVRFSRLLRAAGIRIGPASVVQALRDIETLGIERRDDFRFALCANLIHRREDIEIFELAFELFWREPTDSTLSRARMLESITQDERAKTRLPERLLQALAVQKRPEARTPSEKQKENIGMVTSSREDFQERDFGTMSAAELREVEHAMRMLQLPLPEVTTRRLRPDTRGSQIDLRRTLGEMIRHAGGVARLRRRSVSRRPTDVVLLCDHSGSMDRYTRVLLHFAHALTSHRRRVYTFLFGTHLSNVTPWLRNADVDVSLQHIAHHVKDWAGGTRIATSLHEFNQRWGRRVLSQGAIVLLISDGLDSGAVPELKREMERLAKSCRFLVWLNPLLRFEGFEPKAPGISAMLPEVDAFLPIHNLSSVRQLSRLLSRDAHRN